jgi:hypothetical protein
MTRVKLKQKIPLSIPAVLAFAVAALGGLALLSAAHGLLAFHSGEVVILSRLPAFARLAGGLVLPFLVLLALFVRRAAVLLPVGHRCSPF